jgi:hypothetical protein
MAFSFAPNSSQFIIEISFHIMHILRSRSSLSLSLPLPLPLSSRGFYELELLTLDY